MTTTERQEKKYSVKRIDDLVERLTSIKHGLISELAEPIQETHGVWFIQKNHNKYYQYIATLGDTVGLVRHQTVSKISLADFKANYLQASSEDVVRHLAYLKSKNISWVENVTEIEPRQFNTKFDLAHLIELASKVIKPSDPKKINLFDYETVDLNNIIPKRKGFDTTKCDFYMITVGEKEHHVGAKVRHTSYASAEREAIRLCELTKEEAFIVGVVASVKPVKERKVIVTVTPKVSKR